VERFDVVRRVVTVRHAERGSSLLEVVVALMLIAMGALSVVPLFVSSMDESHAAGDIGWLSAAATARMEALRSDRFYDLAAGGSLTTDVSGYSDASDPHFVVRWEIVDGGGPAGSKTIRVGALALHAAAGRPKYVELTLLRSR
jgi:type II secretory pathway pseudopilin PulG